MNGTSEYSEAAQVNTRHHCASLPLSKQRLPFCVTRASARNCTCRIRALIEEEKCFPFIDKSEWSADMHTPRDSLLCETSVDEEVAGKNGNLYIVLASLLESFRHLFPSLADEYEKRSLDPTHAQNDGDDV